MNTYRLYLWTFFAALILALNSPTLTQAQTELPTIPDTATRFTWERPDIQTALGFRSIDIDAQEALLTILAAEATDAALGLLAINALQAPQLDGQTLVDQLPTESALLIEPDGTALFTYADDFTPTWRGRAPRWERTYFDEVQFADFDRLDKNPTPAKVGLDATLSGQDAFFIRDMEGGIQFQWNGDLRYCFNFGRPLQALSLSDPSGAYHTTLEAPAGFTIRLAPSPSGNWTTVWESSGEGRYQPQITLPPALQGATSLCISLGGADLYAIERFYLTARLEAADLVNLTRFPSGERVLTFTDAAQSSHQAMLFWRNTQLAALSPEPPLYPEAAPEIRREDGYLRLLFPQGVQWTFRTTPDGAPSALVSVYAGDLPLFSAPPGSAAAPLWQLTLLDGQPEPLPPAFNWDAYRDAALPSFNWASLWQRERRVLDATQAQFIEMTPTADGFTLRWQVHQGGASGFVEWILSTTESSLAGEYAIGVGLRFRVYGDGLRNASYVNLDLPLALQEGDWMVEQSFRTIIEEPFSYNRLTPFPDTRWFTLHQSFVYRSGAGRTILAAFDAPTAARVQTKNESGRQYYRFAIPLGAGDDRTTNNLLWFVTARGATSRWAAADIWARLFEDLKTFYSDSAGVIDSRPVPTVVWNLPLEDDIGYALETLEASGDFPPAGETWFDYFAEHQLPRAEAAAIRNVIIQAPWASDGEDPALLASLHAPRSLTVSPMSGGLDGLQRLVDEAHRRGVLVTLWYPSAASLFSPLLPQNLDWLAWEIGGIPEDGGWGDIVGLDIGDGYGQYALQQLAALRQEVPFDGLWMDSWDGLTVLTDYSEPQPAPQLEDAIALQRSFSQLGISQLIIEGLGPLGRPDAYGDYETYVGAPDPLPQQVAELERLRGHEYLLYRGGAGLYIDMEIYHRVLAGGGIVNIANFDEIDALSESERAWLRQVNLDHRRVVPYMKYRKLLVADDRWLGVAWSTDADETTVLFAFEPFAYTTAACIDIENVTRAEETRSQSGGFIAEAYHTYIITPCAD